MSSENVNVEDLYKELSQAKRRVQKIEDRITAFQASCKHTFVCERDDSDYYHTRYYSVCTKCKTWY